MYQEVLDANLDSHHRHYQLDMRFDVSLIQQQGYRQKVYKSGIAKMRDHSYIASQWIHQERIN